MRAKFLMIWGMGKKAKLNLYVKNVSVCVFRILD